MSYLRILACCLIVLLSACSKPPSQATVTAEVQSRSLTPTNEALADIYNRSCRSCHTVAATGAPLTGDQAAWAQRMNKGIDTLVDNVVGGFGGMPPFGLCMACDAQQFEALIRFMAEPE